MNTSERIAENVRAEMGRQDVKTTALARRAGIEQRTMYRLLKGERRWEAEHMEAVAAVLGITWAQLVGLEAVA